MAVYAKGEKHHAEDLERIRNFRLLDDDFMTKCFEGQIDATELVINTILGVSWRVLSVQTQDTIKNLQGRSIRLDIHAVTEDGRHVNVEIQRQDKGAAPKRARYHSSVLDANTLLSGEDYEKLPETYVIFITENDVLKMGKPVYIIERYISGTDIMFGDGAHIVYVNNEIKDDTPIGKLMHDFSCANPDDMYYNLLADRVRYFKKTQEGVAAMCKAMEDMRNETARETARERSREIAENLITLGEMTLDKIAMVVKLPIAEIEELANKLQPQKFA